MSNKIKTITNNRKAYFEYTILSKLEAGISLQGTEVKSARENKVNLKGSYVSIVDGEAFLKDCHIAEYEMGSYNNHEPSRSRKLLLHKREIRKLAADTKEKGLTIIPLSMYFSNGKIKVEIGLAIGKKLWDKRESLKEKDAERKMNQTNKEQWRD